MLLDRTKIYGPTEKESFIIHNNGGPYLNAEADFDDWLTEEEIRKFFPNQTLILRIHKGDDELDFTEAQVVYYRCERSFALNKFWDLRNSDDDEYTYLRFFTLNPLVDSCTSYNETIE